MIIIIIMMNSSEDGWDDYIGGDDTSYDYEQDKDELIIVNKYGLMI